MTASPRFSGRLFTRSLALATIFFLLAASAGATKYVAAQNGDWHNTATWSGGASIPGDNDDVIIPAHITVTYNSPTEDNFGDEGTVFTTTHSYIEVSGKLILGSGTTFIRFAQNVTFVVKNGGEVNNATGGGLNWQTGVLGTSTGTSLLMYIEPGGKFTVNNTPNYFFGETEDSVDSSTLPINSGTQTGSFKLTQVPDNGNNGALLITTTGIAAPVAPYPTITNAAVNAGHLKAGGVVVVTLTFSEPISVESLTGTPRIPLTFSGSGSPSNYAYAVNSTGVSTQLSFSYTVTANDSDDNGIVVGNTIDLNGGTIADSDNFDAVLSFTAPSGVNTLIDNVAPSALSLTANDGSPTKSATVHYALAFSEALLNSTLDASDFNVVTTGGVTGTVTGIANTNGTATSASNFTVTLTGVSGTGTLRLDLKSSGTGITDLAGNLVSNGATGATYTIDNTAPAATTVSFASNNANTAVAHKGDVVALAFTTTEAVQTPVVSVAGHSVTVNHSGGNDYTASYTMLAGDAAGNIAFSVSLTDLVGLTSNFTNISTSQNVVYDTTPTIASTGAFDPVATPQGTASASTHVSISGFNLSAGILVGPPTGFEVSTDGSTYTPTVSINQTAGSVAATTIYLRLAATTPVGFYSGDVVLSSTGASDVHVAIATSTVYSRDATLSSLTTSANGFAPTFDPNTTTGYTANVPNATTTVTLTPTTTDSFTSDLEVRVNGGAPVFVTSGSPSSALALKAGDNTIDVTITAQDGVTTKTYSLTVHRALSGDATLGLLATTPNVHLTKVAGTHYKDFSSTVSNLTSSVMVMPTANDAAATVTVNGVPVTSGSSSGPIHLNLDTNTIYTTVTAQDGVTKKTYAMVITRQRPNNAKLALLVTTPQTQHLTQVAGTNYKDFTATVASSVSTISVTATTQDATATLTVNRTGATSGIASNPIRLNADTTTIFTTVTAGNGVTKNTYAILVTRLPSNNAKLASIVVTNPKATLALASGTNYKDFTAPVTNGTSTVRITATAADTTARLTINGVLTASGTASAPVTLNADTTTIFTTVTAGDGVTKNTYGILVTRQPLIPNVMKYEEQASPIVNEAVIVHQNVSPNGDGKGDALVIEGVGSHPDNKLQIMNRNGALVYEIKGYNNATKSFDGHASTNGELQLPGTYFYSLEYKDGNEVKRKTGFIVLKY